MSRRYQHLHLKVPDDLLEHIDEHSEKYFDGNRSACIRAMIRRGLAVTTTQRMANDANARPGSAEPLPGQTSMDDK